MAAVAVVVVVVVAVAVGVAVSVVVAVAVAVGVAVSVAVDVAVAVVVVVAVAVDHKRSSSPRALQGAGFLWGSSLWSVDSPSRGTNIMPKTKTISIPLDTLLTWFVALGYATHDVDLDYEDEEAREQVFGTYDEMLVFLKSKKIDLKREIKRMTKEGKV